MREKRAVDINFSHHGGFAAVEALTRDLLDANSSLVASGAIALATSLGYLRIRHITYANIS